MTNNNKPYWNNIDKKFDKLNNLHSKKVLCLWSDLLGFGKDLFESQWELDNDQKRAIFERLRTAHKIVYENTSPFLDISLVLNDGVGKVCNVDSESRTHPDEVGIFIRGCVITHLEINRIEIINQLPGCRSVLSFGESIDYIFENPTLDDYVLNYTKEDANKRSKIAEATGNPVAVYNPSPFQMNTAFSKSFILEGLGSKQGLEGSNFFVEQSVIDYMKWLSDKHKLCFQETEEDGLYCVRILKAECFPSFGFEFDKVIDIDYKGWQTKVYRVSHFNPHDEKITDFKYNLFECL